MLLVDCQGFHGASLLPNTLKNFLDTAGGLLWPARIKVHSLNSGKVEVYLRAACHAFTPHVNAWEN